MPQADPLPDPRILDPAAPAPFRFSVCTLMSRPEQYAGMLASFRAAGFGGDCEYLCIDNSAGNVADAFAGYNAFLNEARGEHIILAHQDVVLDFDDRAVLERRLGELAALDPDWGACGNAGGIGIRRNAMRISDPHGSDVAIGPFPQRVLSLDENFIVVRRAANLSLSHDLSGYHMYGPDLCVMADIAGYRCYVIDFHLRHLSAGKLDGSFDVAALAFARKYARAFRSRWVPTTVTSAFLSGSARMRRLASSRVGEWLTGRLT
jgi:hypothetical protein